MRYFLVSALLFTPLAGAEQGRSVVNAREHYKATVPGTWTIWDVESSGALDATSYARSRALEGGLVPNGEAAIRIIEAWERETADQWANGDARGREELGRKKIAISTKRINTVRSYLQVESLYDAGPGTFYRTVADYYILRGRLFRITLEFMQGDPREATYRTILDEVVRSIEATDVH
jgi:hypothetical protein